MVHGGVGEELVTRTPSGLSVVRTGFACLRVPARFGVVAGRVAADSALRQRPRHSAPHDPHGDRTRHRTRGLSPDAAKPGRWGCCNTRTCQVWLRHAGRR